MHIHRQFLTFIEMAKEAVQPIRAEYVHRGSLQYEFGSELLQTPIQLLRISNAEAQVCSFKSRFLMDPDQTIPHHTFLFSVRLLRF